MRRVPTLLILLLAIGLEVAGTVSMKLSEGFDRIIPSLLMALFYLLSFLAFAYCIKRIQISIAYALWTALGMLGITLVGLFFFNEPLSLAKGISLFVITLGVVGLTLDDESIEEELPE